MLACMLQAEFLTPACWVTLTQTIQKVHCNFQVKLAKVLMLA